MDKQNKFPKSIKNCINFYIQNNLSTPKASALNKVYGHWCDIIGKKYFDLCYPQKLTLDFDQRYGNLYVISYNPAASFFINNNKMYIIEKINTYFGYGAIKNIFIKENPMQTQSQYITKEKRQLKDLEIEKINNINKNSEDILSQSLRNLALSFYEYEK